MAVDVKDLPPAYQAQAFRKLAEQEQKKKRRPLPCPAGNGTGKRNKYHNQPTERVTAAGNVLRFDSQKEARRYDELAALEQAGKIRELRMQVDFTLQEAYTDGGGRRVRAIRYKADFTYLRKMENGGLTKIPCLDGEGYRLVHNPEWKMVVEDVKSRATKTKQYAMKRKMMKERFNIDIQEV